MDADFAVPGSTTYRRLENPVENIPEECRPEQPMTKSEWIFIIVGTILIILAVIFSRNLVQKRYGFGTWTTETTPCINESGNCQLPAKKVVIQTCEPNPLTRAGCLYNGRQTYAKIQQETDCILQCRRSKWRNEVSECQQPADCQIGRFVSGTQILTQTCVPFDATGVNGCTRSGLVPLNDGQYQGLTEYQVGTVLTEELPCVVLCK